jgi:hypothetical protein
MTAEDAPGTTIDSRPDPYSSPGVRNRESSVTELRGHMGHTQLPADEGLPFVDPPQ